jgi:surface antigen
MLSQKRALLQFVNGTLIGPPHADDIVIFGPSLLNPYGHVAIISAVASDHIEIAQQNPGPFTPSRETLPLRGDGASGWSIGHPRAKGWLRRAQPPAS